MNLLTPRTKLLATTVLGVAAIAAAVLGLRPEQAKAQGIMAAPGCQCSAPTSIPGISTNVVHCLCGSMSCVISEHTGPGKNTNLMQCVR